MNDVLGHLELHEPHTKRPTHTNEDENRREERKRKLRWENVWLKHIQGRFPCNIYLSQVQARVIRLAPKN